MAFAPADLLAEFHMNRHQISSRVVALAAGPAVAALFGASSLLRANTQLYSFETLYNTNDVVDPLGTRPDDFRANGGGTNVTQDTIGATAGTHSMNFTLQSAATFTGALTNLVPSVLT